MAGGTDVRDLRRDFGLRADFIFVPSAQFIKQCGIDRGESPGHLRVAFGIRAFPRPSSSARHAAMMAQVISASVIGSFARRIIGPASA
jgi:hypothetical protein